jgi:hypothetical protein
MTGILVRAVPVEVGGRDAQAEGRGRGRGQAEKFHDPLLVTRLDRDPAQEAAPNRHRVVMGELDADQPFQRPAVTAAEDCLASDFGEAVQGCTSRAARSGGTDLLQHGHDSGADADQRLSRRLTNSLIGTAEHCRDRGRRAEPSLPDVGDAPDRSKADLCPWILQSIDVVGQSRLPKVKEDAGKRAAFLLCAGPRESIPDRSKRHPA